MRLKGSKLTNRNSGVSGRGSLGLCLRAWLQIIEHLVISQHDENLFVTLFWQMKKYICSAFLVSLTKSYLKLLHMCVLYKGSNKYVFKWLEQSAWQS